MTISNQTINTANVIIDVVSGNTSYTNAVSIAIDYTPYYSSIANSLVSLVSSLSTIANNSTTIASNLNSINNNISLLANLGNNPSGNNMGIRVASAYDDLNHVGLYRRYIEDGVILDTTKSVDQATQRQAQAELQSYVTKVKGLL